MNKPNDSTFPSNVIPLPIQHPVSLGKIPRPETETDPTTRLIYETCTGAIHDFKQDLAGAERELTEIFNRKARLNDLINRYKTILKENWNE